ncbi:MAG TPA: hypothetical protein VEY09_16965 [Pyrinomonadaceae bacterium]|nr:hypothetical protein [Pyrinomonadaceae bacterium]
MMVIESSTAVGPTPSREAAQSSRARRLRPPMHCYWGTTPACPRNGRVTSLGADGCFIKTKAEAGEGQELYVNFWLPTERWLMLRGRVTYHLSKVGFGLAFAGLSGAERDVISVLLDYLDEAQGPHEEQAA